MKNTCILLLATLLSFGSCTQPPTSTANVPIKELYRAKHDDVTIRKHPRSRAFVYRKLRSGSTVYVYNQYNSQWYTVTIDGRQYYALVSSLEIDPSSVVRRQTTIESPSYNSSYSSPSRTIHTGPRGGRYYINKNGNKTYIKRN